MSLVSACLVSVGQSLRATHDYSDVSSSELHEMMCFGAQERQREAGVMPIGQLGLLFLI